MSRARRIKAARASLGLDALLTEADLLLAIKVPLWRRLAGLLWPKARTGYVARKAADAARIAKAAKSQAAKKYIGR